MGFYEKIFFTQNTKMNIRTGIDIVDIPKFAKNAKSDAFIRKVFTPAEIKICEAAADPVQCYAGKFATKEAFMKAIGKGIRQEVWFTQIEISKGETGIISIQANGKAAECLSEMKNRELNISVSQRKKMVVAIVILKSGKD